MEGLPSRPVESPFLLYRDPAGVERRLELTDDRSALTIGRKEQADIALPWDPEVSRVHCELERKAGVWTIADDGLSQNGTWVNGLKVGGRRRLRDGDLIMVGRTTIAYGEPVRSGTLVTLVPGVLGAVRQFSDQQQRILKALSEGDEPPADAQIAAATGVDEAQVAHELLGIARAFGLDDVPAEQWRDELATLFRHSGLV